MIVINLITVLISGGAGVILGIPIGVARARKQAKIIRPICECGHAIGYHDDKIGNCRQIEVERDFLGGRGKRIPCRCQNYCGPEVISALAFRDLIQLPITTEDT